MLDKIKSSGIRVLPRQPLTLLTRDPQDNRILEASLEAQADYIITGNKKHFLPWTEFRKARIVTPREFIDQEGWCV